MIEQPAQILLTMSRLRLGRRCNMCATTLIPGYLSRLSILTSCAAVSTADSGDTCMVDQVRS